MKRIYPILSWYNFILVRLRLSIANTFNDFPWLLEKPGAPLSFKAQSTTADSIYLTWTAPKTNAIPGTIFYRVHYQRSNENRFSINASTFTVYTLTGLMPATTYTVHVIAVNKCFESEPSNQINETTRVAGKCKKYFLWNNRILYLSYFITNTQ